MPRATGRSATRGSVLYVCPSHDCPAPGMALVIVSDVTLERRGDTAELSALVDKFRLYFCFPAATPLAAR